MTPLKTLLNVIAATLRLLSKGLSNWMWVIVIVCILSPISPHVNLRLITGQPCDYLGTRGVISKADGGPCPPVAIINTINSEGFSW